MRKRLLGSIAALAAGAGSAWGQPTGPAPLPVPPVPLLPTPGAGPAGVPLPPHGGPPAFGGLPSHAVPGNAGFVPPPAIMPPVNIGPADDPLGLGPMGGFGPPPGPMYPVPGAYGENTWQPAPRMSGPLGDGSGRRGSDRLTELGYNIAPKWWVDGEYLMWFTNGQPLRTPILTTSAPSDAGIPGRASTITLVGERDLGYDLINGMRLSTGFFGDADRRFGFQAGGFFTERKANTQRFGSFDNVSGVPVFARPFVDLAGVQSTLVLSAPDIGPAMVNVSTTSNLWGVEAAGVWNLFRSAPESRLAWSLDFIAGYKHVHLREDLLIQSRTFLTNQTTTPIFAVGPFGVVTLVGVTTTPTQLNLGGVVVLSPRTVIDIQDYFKVSNSFNGATIGLQGEGRYGMVTTGWFAKVSFGNMHQRLEVRGSSNFFDPTGRSGGLVNNQFAFTPPAGGGRGASFGGLLANASNIGTFVQDRFTYIPEFGVNVGIALTRGLTGYIGGSVVFLPDVIRPGDQAVPLVSSAAVPFSDNFGAAGATRAPRVTFVQNQLWFGGISFGLKYKY